MFKKIYKEIATLSYKKIIKISKYFSRRKLYPFLLKDLNTIQSKNKNKRVIFVGAGGEAEDFLRNNTNLSFTTIDIDSARDPDLVMDVSNMKFNDSSYDLIIMLEVLEHTINPKKAINECYRVLKNKGELILSTPFILGIHDSPNDFQRFTKYGLSSFLKEFNDIKIYSRNGFFESIIVLLLRYWTAKNRLASKIGILFIFIFFPLGFIAILLDKLFANDDVTTGYYVKATK